MTVNTTAGLPIDGKLLHNYFRTLVNHFFKIIPIRENEEESLGTYIHSLQLELFGCIDLIPELQTNSFYLSLLSILQYLGGNPECDIRIVRREVFRAISICNKLKAIYSEEVDGR